MSDVKHDKDSLWLKQWRTFFYILIAVFIIWLGANMSEEKSYTEHFNVAFSGIDTVGYAVVNSDSIVTLNLASNGFRALRRSVAHNKSLSIDVSKSALPDEKGNINVEIDVEEILELLKAQIDLRGVSSVQCITKRLTLSATERMKKGFVPDLSQVDFRFEGMCGLNGDPVVKPDSVWLYGSKNSLEKIETIKAQPQTIKHIMRSGNHKVKLEPVWEKFPDVRTSTKSVELFLPVETFIEKKITVPINVITNKGIRRVHLYPDRVDVVILIPNKEYDKVSADDFEVTVTIEEESNLLHPILRRFPSKVKVKNIIPEEIQYVLISE